MNRLSLLAVVALLSLGLACAKKPDQTASSDQSSQPNAAADQAAAPAAEPQQMAPPAEAPKPEPPKPVVIPAGTVLTVRLGNAVGSKSSQTGDPFSATLAQSVTVGGKTAIAAGASAAGTVTEAKAKGKVKGEARLSLKLTKITVKGRSYLINTTPVSTTEKGKGKRSAGMMGGGAAGGALIGGLAGGGKGAGIGALVGLGAGAVGATMTGNGQIEIPAESALSFKLVESLELKP